MAYVSAVTINENFEIIKSAIKNIAEFENELYALKVTLGLKEIEMIAQPDYVRGKTEDERKRQLEAYAADTVAKIAEIEKKKLIEDTSLRIAREASSTFAYLMRLSEIENEEAKVAKGFYG